MNISKFKQKLKTKARVCVLSHGKEAHNELFLLSYRNNYVDQFVVLIRLKNYQDLTYYYKNHFDEYFVDYEIENTVYLK